MYEVRAVADRHFRQSLGNGGDGGAVESCSIVASQLSVRIKEPIAIVGFSVFQNLIVRSFIHHGDLALVVLVFFHLGDLIVLTVGPEGKDPIAVATVFIVVAGSGHDLAFCLGDHLHMPIAVVAGGDNGDVKIAVTVFEQRAIRISKLLTLFAKITIDVFTDLLFCLAAGDPVLLAEIFLLLLLRQILGKICNHQLQITADQMQAVPKIAIDGFFGDQLRIRGDGLNSGNGLQRIMSFCKQRRLRWLRGGLGSRLGSSRLGGGWLGGFRFVGRSRGWFGDILWLAAGENQSRGQRCCQHQADSGNEECFWLFHDKIHPFFQLFSGFAHGGGGVENADGGVGDRCQKGFAIGNALGLSQLLQGGFITGQLAVPFGHHGSQPHQRVKPVDAQTQAANPCPEMVAMLQVGQLVGQNMIQGLGVGGAFRGQIDSGAEQSRQTRGGHIGRDPHRNRTAAIVKQHRSPLRPAQKQQIGDQKPSGQQRCAADPQKLQQLPQGDSGGFFCLLLQLGLDLWGYRGRHFLPGLIILQQLLIPLLPIEVHHRLLQIFLHLLNQLRLLLQPFRGGGNTVFKLSELNGNQQPQGNQQPCGIDQPPADPLFQKQPQQQDHGNQNGGGDQKLFHFRSPSASFKMA